MRVLLTGASGFVGSHVARLLLSDTHEIYALERPGTDTWRIADVMNGLHLIQTDLTDQEQVAAVVGQVRPELCIHLAWYAEHGKYWNSLENLDILSASLHLARRLVDAGCGRLVGVGTCVEYDLAQGYFSEGTSRLHPRSLYAASKLSLHYLLEQVGDLTAMQTVWARLFYLYGPMEDGRRLVPFVINRFLAGESVETTPGEQVRDYLYVEDVASAIVAVAHSPLRGAVNVGSGIPLTVRDLVTRIAQLVGREDLLRIGALPPNPGDPPFICANPTRLYSADWQPRYDLNSGLQHTIAWWRDQAHSRQL
jgi:nucleoside-diphosphate-sugar epimerase